MLGVLLCLSLVPPSAAKIDPEPPPKFPVGVWKGMWNGFKATATFHPDGKYHEVYYEGKEARNYAGRWFYYPKSRQVVVEEYTLPLYDTEKPSHATYSFSVSKDRRTLKGVDVLLRKVVR